MRLAKMLDLYTDYYYFSPLDSTLKLHNLNTDKKAYMWVGYCNKHIILTVEFGWDFLDKFMSFVYLGLMWHLSVHPVELRIVFNFYVINLKLDDVTRCSKW